MHVQSVPTIMGPLVNMIQGTLRFSHNEHEVQE